MIKDLLSRNKDFVKANFILFASFSFLNLMGYVFHFYAGRSLGPHVYGSFGSLLSLVYIIAMPLTSIQLIITRFVSEYKVNNQHGKIADLFKRSVKKLTFVGIILIIIFIFLSGFISNFLKIGSVTPLIILSLFLLFSLLLPILRGILQGLQKFTQLGMSYALEGISKVLFGFVLISMGFGLSGAVSAFVLSYAIPVLIILFMFWKFTKGASQKVDEREIYKYSTPVIITLLSLTLFYSVDMLLVKHYMSELDAGIYAALSLLGKVIFFGSYSVGMVMLPKLTEDFVGKKNTKKLLWKSLFLVALFGGSATIFYFSFPNFVVSLLFGDQYTEVAKYLGIFGLIMTLFSLAYILAYYNLSIHRNAFIYPLIAFNLIEVGLIWVFHDSIAQIIYVLLGLFTTMFVVLAALTFIVKNERLDHSHTSI